MQEKKRGLSFASACQVARSFSLPSGVHFYTLNQAALSTEIWRRLKL